MEKENNLFSKEASAWFRGIAILMVILSHYAQWWSWFHVEEGFRELVRLALSKMGPYGVAIFFLFSGYGLAKSAGKERITFYFVIRRLINVYIPYLIIVFLIEALSGGFESSRDFLRILHGQDFWYMTVIFLFYIGFIIIWFAVKNKHMRMLLLCLFLYGCNYMLKEGGKQDFWYLSNWAFPIGVGSAVYEEKIKAVWHKAGVVFTIVFAAATVWVVYSGLFTVHSWTSLEEEILHKTWAVVIFTVFIAAIASWGLKYDPILQFAGKYSLYFYLTHTFIFMAVVNTLEIDFGLRFAVASLAIITVSLILGKSIDYLCKIFMRIMQNKE